MALNWCARKWGPLKRGENEEEIWAFKLEADQFDQNIWDNIKKNNKFMKNQILHRHLASFGASCMNCDSLPEGRCLSRRNGAVQRTNHGNRVWKIGFKMSNKSHVKMKQTMGITRQFAFINKLDRSGNHANWAYWKRLPKAILIILYNFKIIFTC